MEGEVGSLATYIIFTIWDDWWYSGAGHLDGDFLKVSLNIVNSHVVGFVN